MLSNNNTTFSTGKHESKRVYVAEANSEIQEAVNSYMEKERSNLLQILFSEGITGEKAEKILTNIRAEAKNKLVLEAAKNIREFRDAARKGDFSWMTQNPPPAVDETIAKSPALK